MRQLEASDEFVPRHIGVGRVWGFITTGTAEIEVQHGDSWVQIANLAEAGTYVDELRRDQRYRVASMTGDLYLI